MWIKMTGLKKKKMGSSDRSDGVDQLAASWNKLHEIIIGSNVIPQYIIIFLSMTYP